MDSKLRNVLPSYIATLFLFIITYFVTVWYLLFFVIVSVICVVVLNKDLQIPLLVAFLIGSISDISLNLYSKTSKGKRSKALQVYFKYMGLIPAAIFGGVLSAMMVANTYAIINVADIDKLYLILLIGLAVGVLWGVVGHYSFGMKRFKVFYDNTSGYLESRFWDGITVPLILIIMYGISLQFDEVWIV